MLFFLATLAAGTAARALQVVCTTLYMRIANERALAWPAPGRLGPARPGEVAGTPERRRAPWRARQAETVAAKMQPPQCRLRVRSGRFADEQPQHHHQDGSSAETEPSGGHC